MHKVEDVVGIHATGTRASSKSSHRSLLVDLVVEDHDAEEAERVRARKEGSPGWNRHEAKHFVRAYPASDGEGEEEEVRIGNEPDEFDKKGNRTPSGQHGLAGNLDEDEEGETGEARGGKEEEIWSKRSYGKGDDKEAAVEGEEQDQTDVARNNHGRGDNYEAGDGDDGARRKDSESDRGPRESRGTEYPDAEENVWASPRR